MPRIKWGMQAVKCITGFTRAKHQVFQSDNIYSRVYSLTPKKTYRLVVNNTGYRWQKTCELMEIQVELSETTEWLLQYFDAILDFARKERMIRSM